MAQNIILVGFMGTGKTTVGQILAEQLGRTFVDTDAVIAQDQGMTIEAIFAEQGEESFRLMEADLAAELGRESDLVVATGGGMIVNLANRAALMANGFLVCLTARDDIIAARLEQATGRPLADDWAVRAI